MRDIMKTVGDLIDKSKIAIISSVDSEGYPNTKAMLGVRERDGIKTLFFSTNTSSMRVKQYRENPKACVYFYDAKRFRGVMLVGTMEVVRDEENRRRLWRLGDRIYYPKGVDDPDYAVLKFTARKGRVYSNFKSESFEV